MLDANDLCICVSTANKHLALVLLHQPLYCCTNFLFVPATDHDTAKAADHDALATESASVAKLQSKACRPIHQKHVALTRSNAALTCKQVLLLLARHPRSAPDSLCCLLVLVLLLLLTHHQPTKVLLVPEAQVLMMLPQAATQRCP